MTPAIEQEYPTPCDLDLTRLKLPSAPRRAPWRDALGWTLLGMALTALLMAGAVYGVLEHVSGYWMGR